MTRSSAGTANRTSRLVSRFASSRSTSPLPRRTARPGAGSFRRRPGPRKLALGFGAIALVVVVVQLCGAPTVLASTATPLTWGTPCSADLDVASCERMTWIANKLDDPPAAVALDGEASDRLDVTGWGVWFLAGLTVCLLFAAKWDRVWRFWRD